MLATSHGGAVGHFIGQTFQGLDVLVGPLFFLKKKTCRQQLCSNCPFLKLEDMQLSCHSSRYAPVFALREVTQLDMKIEFPLLAEKASFTVENVL